MKYINVKNTILVIFVLVMLCLLIVGIKYQKQIKRVITYWSIYRNQDSSCKQCSILFQDGLPTHESAYQYEGIKPKTDFTKLQKLIDKGALREIKESEDYVVEPMDASLPALLPKGITFIHQLAREYRTLCDQHNLEYIPFRITSATRTIQSAKELRKRNGNAIENSAHLKGKTIDISYITNKNHVKQKDLFIQALATLKDKGLCYVKFEVQMKCLHITCR